MSPFDDSSNLTLSRKKRNRRDGDGIRLRSESFLRARIHTPRATRSVSPDPLRAAAISLQNHEFSRRAARRVSIFRKPRMRATFASPEYCHFAPIISNVKHCNLNMDKARRVRATSRYQSKCVHVCISPRGIMYTFTVIGRSESSMLQKSEI